MLIIKDPKHPENEGQVKLFKFGKKIFDKIKEAMQPQFEDEQPIDPFDFWEGANFKLKICKVEGYRNYDRSEFESPSAIAEDDAEIEAIWKREHSLKDFLDPGKFKSYDDMKKRFDAVVSGNSAPIPSAQQQAEADMEQYMAPAATPAPARKPAPAADDTPVPARKPAPAPAESADPNGDDEAAYFASLLNG